MSTDTETDDGTALTRGSLFARVLVGVDGTEAGLEACRQAALVADPRAPIEVIAVVHLGEAARAGFEAPREADRLQAEAERALEEAVRSIGARARPQFVDGLVT